MKPSRIYLLKLCIAVCTLVLLGSSSESFAQQPLRWKFKKGDQFTAHFDQKIQQKTEVVLKPIEMSTHLRMKMTWVVNDVDKKGNALMTQSFDSIKLDWKSAKQEIQFDSESQEELKGVAKQVSLTLQPLMEASYNVEMQPNGEIVNVTVHRDVLKKIRSVPDSMTFRRLFTKEGISNTIKQSTLNLPDDAPKVGMQWEQSREYQSPNAIAVNQQTYKIAEPSTEDGQSFITIGLTGDVKLKPIKGEEGQLKQVFKQNSISGKILFDAEQGNVHRTEITQVLASETPYREMIIKANTTSKLRTVIQRKK